MPELERIKLSPAEKPGVLICKIQEQPEKSNEINDLGKKKSRGAVVDEMWSYVEKKSQPRWLWHAIDQISGKVLGYVFGARTDDCFIRLQELLKPFGITKFYSDDWGAYSRWLLPEQHVIGKKNTQTIERKHLTLRTRIKRLARKTICISKSQLMHDTVIGLFINQQEFGLKI